MYERDYSGRMPLGQSGNMLTMLLAINMLAFVVLGFIKVVFIFRFPESATALSNFRDDVFSWFVMPVHTGSLLHRPWTIISQMFVHIDFWPIFGNMIWLWSFGYIYQDLGGNKRIVPVYIYGGLAGAAAFLIVYNYMPALQAGIAGVSVFGAAPAVMAVATATTMTAPTYRLFPLLGGGIPLWILTAAYILIDLTSIINGNPAPPTAHIAGGLIGIIFVLLLRGGTDIGAWMTAVLDWIGNLFNPGRPKRGKSIKDELFYKSTGQPFTKKPLLTQQRIDMILDKISQNGFNTLTDEEKELLKKAGEHDLS